MAKKRMSVVDMVSSAYCKGAPASGVSWFMLLNDDDKGFVLEVVDALKKDPSLSRLTIAKLLVKELEIKRSPQTVARTLGNLASNH